MKHSDTDKDGFLKVNSLVDQQYQEIYQKSTN